MRKIQVLAALTLVLWSCSDDEPDSASPAWKKLGLDGYIVNELELHGDLLYAATDRGLFSKNVNTNMGFELVGLPDRNIEDVLFYSDADILVSVTDPSYEQPPALYESLNAGDTWNKVVHNFGGGEPEPVFDLSMRRGSTPIIYATGYAVIARSSDRGRTWEPIWGQWGSLATGIATIEVCPESDAIWAGGQGAIENGFLLHSADEQQWTTWSDLVPNPTVVKEIAFEDADKLYVGFEGALLRTVNKGASWQTLIESEENRFFFGLRLSEIHPGHVFAGGWLKTPDAQPLMFYQSRDNGTSWQIHSFDGESFGGVYDMTGISESGRERIFMGLFKGGVYEVTVPIR